MRYPAIFIYYMPCVLSSLATCQLNASECGPGTCLLPPRLLVARYSPAHWIWACLAIGPGGAGPLRTAPDLLPALALLKQSNTTQDTAAIEQHAARCSNRGAAAIEHHAARIALQQSTTENHALCCINHASLTPRSILRQSSITRSTLHQANRAPRSTHRALQQWSTTQHTAAIEYHAARCSNRAQPARPRFPALRPAFPRTAPGPPPPRPPARPAPRFSRAARALRPNRPLCLINMDAASTYYGRGLLYGRGLCLCMSRASAYGWMPHNASFGFLDLTPSILLLRQFWD
jgi:hypothetical protein